MKELSKYDLISDLDEDISEICEPYQMKKQRRVQFASSSVHSAVSLKLVHIDVWGPAPISVRNGVRHFLIFIDDFSRKVWVYFMNKKSEVFTKFKV